MRLTYGRILLLAGIAFLSLTALHVSAQTKKEHYLLISGYTKLSDTQGIAVYHFDEQTGAISFHSVAGGIENPSFLATSKNGDKVYAVSETDNGMGIVVGFRFDADSGKLHRLNEASSGGRGPCYVSIDDGSTHVFAANYGSGSVGAIPVNAEGLLDTSAVQSIQHQGGSIDKNNQKGPHAHSAVLSPDGRFLLVANLGNDRVYVYRFDATARNGLSDANPPYASVSAGSGPRHICFHPNKKYMYVVNELAGSVHVFDYNNGSLTFKQTITMLPDGFSGTIEAADIHVSPDGKFVYASNRQIRNEIVIYRVTKNGRLQFAGRQSVLGSAPRNFVIDPSGKFLLVANVQTNDVVVFRRNPKTGLLIFTGKKYSVPAPSCLKFVER